MKISFIIPCYNSENTIQNVVSEIKETMKKDETNTYEIILVDDYSKDKTAETIKKIANSNIEVTSVLLSKNSGQPSALLAGFNYASGDYVITLDDDGQAPVSFIFDFIDKIKKDNYDVVCARYTRREKQTLFRKMGSKFNEKLLEVLLDKPHDIYMSSFICAKKFVIQEIIKYRTPYPFLAGLILGVTSNIGNVDVVQRERLSGHSNYNFKKLFTLLINGCTGYSIKPLRITIILGSLFVLWGIIFLLLSLFIDNFNQLFTLSAIISIPSGVNMQLMGIVGEYIGRSYMCTLNKPAYIVKEVINSSKKVQ